MSDGDHPVNTYVRAYADSDPHGSDRIDLTHDRGTALRILLARAANHDRAGRSAQSVRLVARAMELTEEEGFRLPFIQLGERVRTLLLNGRGGAVRNGPLVAELLSFTAPHPGSGGDLADPLSPRELVVLRHLVADMDTNEIASDMSLSRNTIRTHTKEHLPQVVGGIPTGCGAPRRCSRPALITPSRMMCPLRVPRPWR